MLMHPQPVRPRTTPHALELPTGNHMKNTIAAFGTAVPFFAATLAVAAAPGAAPPAGVAGAVADQAAAKSMTVLQYVQSGGPLGYVLIALSVVGLALVIRNLLVLRTRSLAPPELIELLQGRVAAGDLPGIIETCSTAA